MNMWFAHHLNRGHVLYNRSKHGTEYIGQGPLHARVWYSMQQRFCETFIYNKCVLTRKQQFSPLYSYQKFSRSGQKIWERSQATERVFWEKIIKKFERVVWAS